VKVRIDIPDDHLQAIDHIAAAQQRPPEAIIQDAVATYLAEHRRHASHAGFGLWGDLEMDGVEYQRKLREEWDNRA